MNASIGKLLVLIGSMVIVIGLVFIFMPKNIPLGRLPGDIYIKGKNFTFSFPLVTCILISIIVSLIFWLVNYFRK